MAIDTKCHYCKEPSDGFCVCVVCDDAMTSQWPCKLGDSIRSFARRARAEELERTIWEGAHEAADHHVIGRHSSARSGWYRVSAALTELATMAKESA
jgi:hypothetical protein